jgi:hypothetical protein
MDEKLWELRLKVIEALDNLMSEKAIKSTENKISGYTDRGVLMSPENMQNTISLLEKAKETNKIISGFGRSALKVKKEEENNINKNENMLNRFGRSVCTSDEPTAYDRIKEIEDSKKKKKSNMESIFINAMKELEKYMQENEIVHPFKCKNKKLNKKNIDEMIDKANSLELEDQFEKIKVLRSINKIKSQSLFQFCDKKPYQCLICPYYYKSLPEYSEMVKRNNKRKEIK